MPSNKPVFAKKYCKCAILPNAITLSLALAEFENSVVCGRINPLLRACKSPLDKAEERPEPVDEVLHDAVERRENERSGIAGGMSSGESSVGVKGGEKTSTSKEVLMIVGDVCVVVLTEGKPTGPEMERVEIKRVGRLDGFGRGFDVMAEAILASLPVFEDLVGFGMGFDMMERKDGG